MGLLTDFFLATARDVQTCSYDGFHERFTVLQAKRIDPMQLAWLEHVLVGTDFGPKLEHLDWSLVRDFDVDGEGPWICLVRPELTTALESLVSPRVEEVAQAWAETEEWQFDLKFGRGTTEDLAEDLSRFLKDLTGLVQERPSTDYQLYVCIGL